MKAKSDFENEKAEYTELKKKYDRVKSQYELLYSMVERVADNSNLKIKRCSNCNGFFVVNNARIKYCDVCRESYDEIQYQKKKERRKRTKGER